MLAKPDRRTEASAGQRITATPEPGGDRTLEVQVAQELLQTMGFRTFVPLVAGCHGSSGRRQERRKMDLARFSNRVRHARQSGH